MLGIEVIASVLGRYLDAIGDARSDLCRPHLQQAELSMITASLAYLSRMRICSLEHSHERGRSAGPPALPRSRSYSSNHHRSAWLQYAFEGMISTAGTACSRTTQYLMCIRQIRFHTPLRSYAVFGLVYCLGTSPSCSLMPLELRKACGISPLRWLHCTISRKRCFQHRPSTRCSGGMCAVLAACGEPEVQEAGVANRSLACSACAQFRALDLRPPCGTLSPAVSYCSNLPR